MAGHRMAGQRMTGQNNIKTQKIQGGKNATQQLLVTKYTCCRAPQLS
jgi:hypothetical protein